MAKSIYSYTTDGAAKAKVLLDDDKATIGGFAVPASNDSSILVPGFGHRMRGVYGKTAAGKIAFFPMGTKAQASYVSDSSVAITYKSETYNTISRRGERILFG